MIFHHLNKSYLQEACSGLAPNTLLFPDISDGNLLSETASSIALVQYLYQGENQKKTTNVMKQKRGRGAEKGITPWKPTHSSVHISRGRIRKNRRNTCSPSQKSCGCMVKSKRIKTGSTYWRKLVYSQVCSAGPSRFVSQRELELVWQCSIIWTEWVFLWLCKNIIVLTNWFFFPPNLAVQAQHVKLLFYLEGLLKQIRFVYKFWPSG